MDEDFDFDIEDDEVVGKSKKDLIEWSSDREYALAAEFQRSKCGIKIVGGKTEAVKWTEVVAALLKKACFADLPNKELVNQSNLNKKMKRMLTKINKKAAMEQEGVNLSGLSETPLDRTLISISEAIAESKKAKDAKKAKGQKRTADMLVHESSVLGLSNRFKKMPCPSPVDSTLTASENMSTSTPVPPAAAKPTLFEQYLDSKSKFNEARQQALERNEVRDKDVSDLKAEVQELKHCTSTMLALLTAMNDKLNS